MDTQEFMDKTANDINMEISRLLKSDRFRSMIGEMVGAFDYTLEGGKRLRPTMGLLINQAYQGDYVECLELISAIELLHQGSLMHDDIIDGDRFRRGKASMFELAGVAKGVIGGQRLVAEAFRLGFGRGTRIVNIIAEGLTELIDGNNYDQQGPGFDEKLAVKIASMKTGSLYSASGKLGAVMARCMDRDVFEAAEYGRTVGIAFQLADDCVDVVKSTVMRQRIGDMAACKLTVPIIKLNAMADDKLKQVLLKYHGGQLLTKEEESLMFDAIQASRCVEQTLDVIGQFVNEARNHIPASVIPDYRVIMNDVPQVFVDMMLAEIDTEKWW